MPKTVPVERLEKLWRRFRRKMADAVTDKNRAKKVGAGEYEDKCWVRIFAWKDAADELRKLIDEAKEKTDA